MGEAGKAFSEAIHERASDRVTVYGLDETVQMGPVITQQSRARIEGLVEKAIHNGGRAVVDGRTTTIRSLEKGSFLRPTVLEDVAPSCEVYGY